VFDMENKSFANGVLARSINQYLNTVAQVRLID